MNPTDKDRLLLFAAEAETPGFSRPDDQGSSFLVDCGSAKHLHPELAEHRSAEMKDLEKSLHDLWPADDPCSGCIPVILAAYLRAQQDRERMLPQIEIYNYMM